MSCFYRNHVVVLNIVRAAVLENESKASDQSESRIYPCAREEKGEEELMKVSRISYKGVDE